MRLWALFTEPVSYHGEAVGKIMLYEKAADDVSVFLYPSSDAQICLADEWYPGLRDALEAWDEVPHTEWTAIGDPLPGCQEDAAEPIRVKGRGSGAPEWGKYEILRGGAWRDYTEKE